MRHTWSIHWPVMCKSEMTEKLLFCVISGLYKYLNANIVCERERLFDILKREIFWLSISVSWSMMEMTLIITERNCVGMQWPSALCSYGNIWLCDCLSGIILKYKYEPSVKLWYKYVWLRPGRRKAIRNYKENGSEKARRYHLPALQQPSAA